MYGVPTQNLAPHPTTNQPPKGIQKESPSISHALLLPIRHNQKGYGRPLLLSCCA